MQVIGITGGVGSGKSEVLAYLEKNWNAYVCQADEVAKMLQKQGQPVYNEIVRLFGEDILLENRELDRVKLGTIVFHDSGKLHALNQITHPAVKQCIKNEIEKKRMEGAAVFLVEAALLLEDHYEEICDELWYVHVENDVRRERLRKARGYSDEKIDSMFASQLSESVFREKCDRVIENSGSFEETKQQLQAIGEKMNEIM